MIAPVAPARQQPSWHAGFLALLPTLVRYLRANFRDLPAEAREDAVEEALANACVAYARLAERGLTDKAVPGALARYATAQYRVGRRVGCRLNVHDVLSPYARWRRRIVVERLEDGKASAEWREAVVEDHRTPVADQVAFRIDFPGWLDSLTPRSRRVAQALALGNTTKDVARLCGVTAGRVSQARRELHASWQQYQGEDESLAADAELHCRIA
jgi:hypothetical protein